MILVARQVFSHLLTRDIQSIQKSILLLHTLILIRVDHQLRWHALCFVDSKTFALAEGECHVLRASGVELGVGSVPDILEDIGSIALCTLFEHINGHSSVVLFRQL